ncbi:MAG: FGGY-family carbohydrate kinase, partial [Promethearchaeota archaeon]
KNFKVAFKNFITESNDVNIKRLEKEALQKLEDIAADLESYFLKIPLYFPYIEGEPRGPNGRGRVKGGFIIIRENSINCIDLYISLIIGIVNMYKHNLEVLDTPDNYNEIRLTGLIARKSRLFLRFLASLVNKKVVIMKTKQSVAWATGMRALTYLGVLEEMPPVTTLDPILPEDNKLKKILTTLYRRYMEVYQTPDNYQIIQSEEEID